MKVVARLTTYMEFAVDEKYMIGDSEIQFDCNIVSVCGINYPKSKGIMESLF